MIEERKLNYDLLRIVAIFFMILLQVSASVWYYLDDYTFEWKVANIYDAISRFCVPIFIMISGVFFGNNKKVLPFNKLFFKYIFRIITSFLFWSLCYAFCFSNFINNYEIKLFFIKFIEGHYHLWFLYLIFGIYLIVPLLRLITNDKKNTEYFLVLWFVFTIILNNLNHLSPIVNNIWNSMKMNFVIGYSGYFVLGHYLNIINIKRKIKYLIYVFGLIVITVTVIISTYGGKDFIYLFDYLMPTTFFSSVAIFVLFKEEIGRYNINKKWAKIIVNISFLSFGIYLIHVFVLHALLKYIPVLSFNPILSIFFLSVATFIISLILIYFISKIPLLKKYII